MYKKCCARDCEKNVARVTQCIKNVARVIARRRAEFIRFPVEEKRRETKFRFSQIANFPGVVGLVDGTHILIQVKIYTDNKFFA